MYNSLRTGCPTGNCIELGSSFNVNAVISSTAHPLMLLTSDYLLAFRQQPVEVEVSLSYVGMEKKPYVFAAGRTWLNRGEVNSLHGRFLTYPIEFDATVNGWEEENEEIAI